MRSSQTLPPRKTGIYARLFGIPSYLSIVCRLGGKQSHVSVVQGVIIIVLRILVARRNPDVSTYCLPLVPARGVVVTKPLKVGGVVAQSALQILACRLASQMVRRVSPCYLPKG